jgi:signal transduction histidine kinase
VKDLSLHILDIVQNSVSANASVIEINLDIDTEKDYIKLAVKDNGKGMDSEFLKYVTDPFTTTRTTRKVGLGIPLLKQNAELTGGSFSIDSQLGQGTELLARFIPSNIDCLPLGDIAGTLALLICSYPAIEFKIRVKKENELFEVSSSDISEALDGIPLNNPQVYPIVKEFIYSNLDELQITDLG